MACFQWRRARIPPRPTPATPSLLLKFPDGGVEVQGLGVLEGVAVLDGLALDDPFDGELDLLHVQGVGDVRTPPGFSVASERPEMTTPPRSLIRM
jgi:hypothetical protein